MESHPVLSDAEGVYIASQSKEEIPKGNISEYRRRIARKVQLAFRDFEKILNSKVLPQSYKDKVFDQNTLASFLAHFTYYDKENTTLAEEHLKQEIAKQMIEMGIGYFRQRYPATFAISHLNDAINLLYEIANLSRQQVADEQALEFYKMRGKLTLPPLLQPNSTDWQALCMICWKYGTGETHEQAIASLRHAKMCQYDMRHIQQCLKFVPPVRRLKQKKRNGKEKEVKKRKTRSTS